MKSSRDGRSFDFYGEESLYWKVLIKDREHARMSAQQAVAKRARVREKVPWHTVVISNFGDKRPEETIPDALTTFLLGFGKSLTNYIVVPDFGPEPFFLANYRWLLAEDVLDSQQKIKYSKGTLNKLYVKEIIPSTAHLRDIASEVMFILSHGSERNAYMRPPQPGYLSFLESNSVSVDGQVRVGNTPESARIWSCSSYTAWDDAFQRKVTYQKPPGGVTLSQVVGQSDLVFMLSCCTGPIMEEYSSDDDGSRKPDFVVFLRSVPSHDISFNTFLALLITALEVRVKSGKGLYWDGIARTLVCQVMLWVKEHGADEHTFWNWLRTTGIILPGENAADENAFRIKGCLCTYPLTFDARLQKHDKLIVLEELESLTLMIWHDGGGAEARGYDKIDQRRPTAHLVGWRDSTLDLRTYQGFGRAPTLVYEPDVGGMASAPPQNCHVTAAHLAAMADILQYRVGHPPARLYTSSSATHDAQ
jgi:hypothetical protein